MKEKQNDDPKLSSDIQPDDATPASQGHEKFYFAHNEHFRFPNKSKNGLREQGEITSLPFVVIRVEARSRILVRLVWDLYGLNFSLAPKQGARFYYWLTKVWNGKESGSGGARKLFTVKQKWVQTL